MFTFRAVMDGIQSALALAEQLMPVAKAAGLPIAAPVLQIAQAATDIIANLQIRIAEGSVIASSTDQAEIKLAADKLSAINDQLSDIIGG